MSVTAPPAAVGGRYRLERVLGKGAMGAVYEATQLDLDRKVAVKLIPAELVTERTTARFKVEALATSQLCHPNVVGVYDFGMDADCLFLVLEHLSGRTLQQELATRGRMPWPRAIHVLRQIAAAVAAAHRAGIIHRDLKPTNIFLCDGPGISDFVKVLDYGIAKIVGDDAPGVATTTGVLLGTPGYIAPERMRSGPEDPRSDVYALGCIAWELLVGRPVFSADNGVLLLVKHFADPAARVRDFVDVPGALDVLVASLLEKSPLQRPGAEQVLSSLRALLPR